MADAADTLRSTQIAEVVDLWGEGPIQGLVSGLESVYLDKVPLQNSNGSMNFKDVQFGWVLGTQDQAALPGIKAVQTEVAVNVEVTQPMPVVRSITTPGVDSVRITIATAALVSTSKKSGKRRGTEFTWAVDVQNDGAGFVQRHTDTVRGRATSVYRRSVVIELTGTGPWDVRVRRVTADSTNELLQNAFTWTSYTEIQSLKLRMPNSAASFLRVNAANFQRVPERAFDVLGLVIEVPTNYDPLTRAYTGSWDGTFKRAWTDNPAWCYYALATNPRYGLGQYVGAGQANKWQLYTIARYCDEYVKSGRKNTLGIDILEPRFTCNLYLQLRAEARQVMQDLAALFRGISFWAGGQLQTVQDAPSEVSMHYAPANVIDGLFTYQSNSGLQRHSVFVVYWNDLTQFGKRVPEVYVDEAAVARFGIREIELSPIGTTSRGQAQRLARWAAYSEEMEGEAVSFRVGADGALVLPGKVFEIADPNEAGERLGGRIRSATISAVTLDSPVDLVAGDAYMLSAQLPAADGSGYVVEQRPVTDSSGTGLTVLHVYPPFTTAPAPESMWLLQSDALYATTWRCLGAVEVAGADQFEINGVAHNPGKFALIEDGVRLDAHPISNVRLDSPVPTDIYAVESSWVEGGLPRSRVTINWTPGGPSLTHQVSYSHDDNPTVVLPETSLQSVEILDLPAGQLVLFIRSKNGLGNTSPPVEYSVVTAGTGTGTGRGNLIDPSWWQPGADWEWALAQTDVDENSITWGQGPRGAIQALWQAVAAGTPVTDIDGGWYEGAPDAFLKNFFEVDTSRTYRFSLPVLRVNGTATIDFGPTPGTVCTLNTSTPASPAYFVGSSTVPVDKWCLLIGYVFPAGSTGLSHAGSGVFDMDTGVRLEAGLNFCWAADAEGCGLRAYQFAASTGATMQFAPPAVELVDGTESAWVAGPRGARTYLHLRYSNDGGATFTASGGTVPGSFLGVYSDDDETASTDVADYTWSQIRGTDGTSIPGTSAYVHLKYSNDGGASFTASAGEVPGTWLGQYTDGTLADSTDPTVYTWARIYPDNYRQEADPGAVPDSSHWSVPSSGRSYVRQGGVWVPVVGNDSVDTPQIKSGAVTENVSSVSTTNFPSLPNSTADFSSGVIALGSLPQPANGGIVEARSAISIRTHLQNSNATVVEILIGYYGNGVSLGTGKRIVLPNVFYYANTGGGRHLEIVVPQLFAQRRTGPFAFSVVVTVRFWNSSNVQVSPGTNPLRSELAIFCEATAREIKV